MVPSRKEIIDRMEKLGKGKNLTFGIPETFGAGVAIIHLNAEPGKKYVLKVAKDEKTALESKPYWEHDNPKHLAKWVADRLGDLVE
jgi:hypothetical protein